MQDLDFKPIQSGQRIVIVDILRGWALLGVVLMNYQDFFFMGTAAPQIGPVSNVLLYTASIFFAAKSWTLLSFLFGFGFAVLMKNASEKGVHSGMFFMKRMFWLLVLAVINSALFYGDILKDYAVLGVILLLFNRSSAKTAFRLSIVLLIIIPFVAAYVRIHTGPYVDSLAPYYHLYKNHNIIDVLWFGLTGTWHDEVISLNYAITVHIVMLCCFFLGLAAQKFNFFGNILTNKKHIKRIFWISLIISTLLLISAILTNGKKYEAFYAHFSTRYLLVLSTMLFIASGICWLYFAGKMETFFASMQIIGKMTLTNYMTQNLIGLFLFSGFGLGFGLSHKLSLGYYYFFAIFIYILQIYFSKWWLTRYYYGPIEWVWRQLSYGKRLPIRRE
jgi:uncharacterized protein